MRIAVYAAILASAVLAGCGDSSAEGDDDDDDGEGANGSGANGTGASGTGAAGGTAAGGAGSGGGATGGAGGTPVPFCQEACGTSADCETPAVPSLSADNYTCDGTCTWIGCLNDTECQAIEPTYVCRDFFGLPNCFKGCSQPADCVLPIQSQDLDNWECVSGGCRTLGCLSDAECQADFGATYRCRTTGVNIPFCSPSCLAPADCATAGGPAFDADNWACNDSFCDYAGCESSEACQASLGSTYVCE